MSDLLKVWQMDICRPSVNPGDQISLETSLEIPEETIDPQEVLKVQKISGSLIWLSTRTRPDITFAQSRISSMATRAPKRALAESKRLMRYLAGTVDLGLKFSPVCFGESLKLMESLAYFSEHGMDNGHLFTLDAFGDANFQLEDLKLEQ